MKKLTIIMLCLLLTAGCMLVSCNGDNGDVSQTASDTSTVSIDGYDPESGRYVADLPDFKWDATNETYSTFKVCVYSNVIETTYFSEDIGYDLYTTTDEVINDAVRERNNLVLEKTGVTVTACPGDKVFTAVQNDIVWRSMTKCLPIISIFRCRGGIRKRPRHFRCLTCCSSRPAI